MADVEQQPPAAAGESANAASVETVATATDDSGDQSSVESKTVAPAPVWNDITDEFFGAVKDLKLGELVHHEIFGLFEAMSAIEMMDPKMDAGMCCNKNTETPLTFESAVAENRLKLTDLSVAETVGIMDGLLSCLVSWLEGHSVAQTLFTCLYLHQPHQIRDKALRSFCLGMCRLIQVMRSIIFHASVYEEEDFELRDYEFDLQPKVTDARACFQLKEAEDQLQQRIKKHQHQQQQQQQSPPTANTTEPAAIASRLRFLRLLLESLVALWPAEHCAPNRAEMLEIQKLLSGAVDTIATIRDTIALGTQPEPGADEPNPMGFSPLVNQRLLPPTFPRFTKIKPRAAAIEFLGSLSQRLRTVCNIIKCPTYHAALNFCIDFSRNTPACLLARALLQTLYFPVAKLRFGLTPFAEVLRDGMRQFCSPPVLTARHPLAGNEHALHCFGAFIDYSTTTYPFVAFIQLCGFNKARQRDKLVRLLADLAAVTEEADRVDQYMHQILGKDHPAAAQWSLQAAAGAAAVAAGLVPGSAAAVAAAAGSSEVQPYFSTWMMYHSLRAMHWYLLAGVELELYAQHEFVYVFWYLAQFVCNWQATTLARADQLAEHSRAVVARWPAAAKGAGAGMGKGGGGAGGGGGGGAGAAGGNGGKLTQQQLVHQLQQQQLPYQRELVLTRAYGQMYAGYWRAMVAFGKEGRVRQPMAMFDSERVRFEHRFAAFACNATLPPVPFEEFEAQRAFLEAEPLDQLYGEAGRGFQEARGMLEMLLAPGGWGGAGGGGGGAQGGAVMVMTSDQEMSDIIRVCKVNGIVMNLMARGHMKDNRSAPTFDFGTHKYYPTIRIQ